jgi:hypothetical protein
VTEEVIIRLAPRLTELQNIDLASCKYAVTELTFKTIAQHCPTLRRLGLYECKDVSEAGIASIIQSCPQMRRLIFHRLMLKLLNLHFRCSSLTDATLMEIGRCLPHLETLNVSYCDKLTSPALVFVISQCTKLRKLVFSHCLKVGSTVIDAIATHLRWKVYF